ncbi:MAG: hypothetical protein HKN00_01135 [Flavobacteriaceae bacterium]|nr:hypothetical protein [Bacteroidia bacterium]NNF73760.1 hypothetical protein [Flavobacteriaceae bacterium]NNK72536.1 hypothetical protein [Flavobacteriaceae bacterium]
MKNIAILICLYAAVVSCEKPITAETLLNRSISYHDPGDNWPNFNGTFQVKMETPGQSERLSEIRINLPDSYFYLNAIRDSISTEYEITDTSCSIRLNGKTSFGEAEKENYRLTCERGSMYKNYYTYLYGLPMKLKDPGTILDPTIENRPFKGKDYLVLKASYDKNVGSDVWYFYFDPKTYAMEIYQFFKTDENGIVLPESGEYILLSEMSEVNGIDMPKIRAWYYNKDDKYLGTDTLIQ